jgi:hypothetical protein
MNRVWKMCSSGIIATNGVKHKAGVNEGGWIQKFDAAFSSRPAFFGIRCLLAPQVGVECLLAIIGVEC